MPKLDNTGPSGNGPRLQGRCGSKHGHGSCNRQHEHGHHGNRCCEKNANENSVLSKDDEIDALKKRIACMQTRLIALQSEQTIT